MKKSRLLGAVCAVLFSFLSMSSQAALIGVLPSTPSGTDWQTYYDDVADLTWLANANVNGAMTWQAAKDWAGALDIDGNPGADGWRLPDTLQPDASCGGGVGSTDYYCTGSEMGNLFHNVLGGVAGTSIATTHNANYNLFSNVPSGYYWSSTEYAPDTNLAWYFYFDRCAQTSAYKFNKLYAWAVQSSNAGVVPIPPALWLFGSGLLGLIGIARRKS